MPSTNKTPNIGIGQYLPNDILSWDDINADNAIVDEAIAGRLDKTAGGTVSGAVDFTGGLTKNGNLVAACETGDCVISVAPAGLGLDPSSYAKYTVIGNKCFIDMLIRFTGNGKPSTSEEVVVSLAPVPINHSFGNRPLVYVSYTSGGVHTTGYVNFTVDGRFLVAISRRIGDTSHFSTADVRDNTRIIGQIWYETQR